MGHATREIPGVAAIAGDFEGVLLDQYGVLHDGRAAFPHAHDAVRRLRAAGCRIAVVSNSGKSAAANGERLARLGFPAELFDAVATSGEMCRLRLEEEIAAGRLPAGARVFVVGSGVGALPIEGLPLSRAESAEEADLALIAGRAPDRFSLEEDIARLAPLARRGIRCLCANPDRLIYTASGEAAPGGGALADAYAAAGGPVERLGKPHAAFFRLALDLLGDIEPSRVLMVGDSLEHDIAGAKAVGCRTLLVQGGVQSAVLPTPGTGSAAPNFSMPRLRW